MALLGVKYDRRAIVWLAWNALFHANSHRNHEYNWYCTEAVQFQHIRANPALDVWGQNLPTPYTTEKRLRAGQILMINHLYAHSHPRFYQIPS
jgi:hypothetical protein